MEFKQIQELIKSVNKTNISKVKIKDGDFEITIKQAFQTEAAAQATPAQQFVQSAPAQQVQPAPAQQVQSAPVATEAPAEEASNLITVTSPMIGTFYRSSSPDKPPFVSVGDDIKVGDVVCIVEAMKLFNEIESEVSGKIVKVLVDDANPVEYDQPLFLVEPN